MNGQINRIHKSFSLALDIEIADKCDRYVC